MRNNNTTMRNNNTTMRNNNNDNNNNEKQQQQLFSGKASACPGVRSGLAAEAGPGWGAAWPSRTSPKRQEQDWSSGEANNSSPGRDRRTSCFMPLPNK